MHRQRVPLDPRRPELNCVDHLLQWFQHQKELLGRDLNEDDPVFPCLMSSGRILLGKQPLSYQSWMALIKSVIKESNLAPSRRREFSGHCTRRGSVQWRLYRAPSTERWTLEQIRWWAGWTPNEKVMKYSCRILHSP